MQGKNGHSMPASPEITGTTLFPVYDSEAGERIDLEVGFRQFEGARYVDLGSLRKALSARIKGEFVEEETLGSINLLCGLSIHPEERVVTIGGAIIPNNLQEKQFRLLYALMSKPRHIYARQELCAVISDEFVSDRTVDVHMQRLRSSLDASVTPSSTEKRGPNHEIIRTLRGMGYILGRRALSNEQLAFPRRVEQAS